MPQCSHLRFTMDQNFRSITTRVRWAGVQLLRYGKLSRMERQKIVGVGASSQQRQTVECARTGKKKNGRVTVQFLHSAFVSGGALLPSRIRVGTSPHGRAVRRVLRGNPVVQFGVLSCSAGLGAYINELFMDRAEHFQTVDRRTQRRPYYC